MVKGFTVPRSPLGLAAIVDNYAAMVRGWTQGFPKQLGSIFQTRTFTARSPAMAPVEPGGRFAGSLSCHGHRLADLKVTNGAGSDHPLQPAVGPAALLPASGEGQVRQAGGQ